MHDSPQQNGVAERLNATLVALARAMLLAKNLPKYLWAEAVNYATWLKNRLPSKATPKTTLHELVFKEKPSLANAHEFGVKVFVRVEDAGKLEARAEEAMFVGVDSQSKAYRVYWPEKRKVSVERNVTFAPLEVVVGVDAQDEGESMTISTNASHRSDNAPNVQVTSPPPPLPTTPPRPPIPLDTPPALRPKCTHYPPGYYASLNEGESVNLAIDLAETDLLDKSITHHMALAAAVPEPTLQQALNGPDGIEWQEAIDYEISQLEKLGTWEIVNAPSQHANIIPCHFVLATKRGPNGEKLKLHARLVANGQCQKYGVDFFDTFAPTSNMATIRTILGMAAQRDWEIHQVDIKSAYLYAELKEEIHARPTWVPQGRR